jgi:flagellar protein FlaG
VGGGGAAEVAPPPLPSRAGQSSAPPPEPPTVLGDGPRSESNAEFLARQAAAEVTGGPRQTFARFVVDHETHQVSVEIVDAASNKVVRSIPNDELRRMAQRFSATQGMLLDSAV